MSAPLPHAVVLGLSPTGLYAARELGGMGVRCLGVEREFACASLSRVFRRGDGVWHEPDPARLLERLRAYAERLPQQPVLIPTSDYYIDFTMRHFAALSRHFALADGYREVAGALLDKAKFHALCTRHSAAAPRVWQVANTSALADLPATLPLPCLLKPTLIHAARPFLRGRKVLVVHERAQLFTLARDLPAEAGGWLVQELIPGAESRITLLAGYASADARRSEVFTARKLRQFPPGFGSASQAISEVCEETRAQGLRLVEAAGYRGVFGAEFKRDPRDGRLRIIEINARPTLWFQLSHAAGKRLVDAQYRELAGLPPAPSPPQRDGVRWRYLLKDLASAVWYRRQQVDAGLPPPDLEAGPPVTARCWPVFSLRDPLPALAELFVYARKALRRLR